MEKAGIEAPLLLDDTDIESHVNNARMSRVANEDSYINIPGDSSETAAAISQEGLQRRHRRSVLLVTISTCCMVAILFLSAANVYHKLELHPGGGFVEDSTKLYVGNENEFYKASRTGYHFQPEMNWMNDPNAPMFYMGYYHFFYQYNPVGPLWAQEISWGHAVSTDLIHWTYLEIAMKPDQWYDIGGVWSGSATILPDGTPAILYTGVGNESSDWAQSQSLAVPADPSDPFLRKWKKIDANPIIVNPDNVKPGDFRDPSTAWLEQDGFWRLVVGAKRDNADGSRDGISLLYKSSDFNHWELEEKVLHEVAGTGMWECVDFYPVFVQGKNGLNHSALGAENYLDSYKYVLKISLQDTMLDHYAIGEYSTETHTFNVDDASLDVGLGPRYDYGKFYASKTFYDTNTGRRILWGWVSESDSEQDDLTKGWASVQAIPRTVWFDGKTSKNLLQWPVEEVEALRGARASFENIELQPTSVLKVQGGDGPQLDITVVFEKPDVNSVDGLAVADLEEFDCSKGGSAHRGTFGPFGLLVHANDALTEHTGVFFYISLLKDGNWATCVCSDQSRSSLATSVDRTVYGSYVTVLSTENELSLRILLDHSIVETFAQGGRLAITSRVYPTLALGSNSHLFLFNNGTIPIVVKSLDVYKMSRVKMATL